MDRIRPLFLLLAMAVLLSGCGNQGGKVREVTSSFDSVKCRGTSAIENEFIVHWEDGSFSVEKGDNPEQFKNDFVTSNIEKIRHVQINQKIQLVQPTEQSTTVSGQAASNWGQQIIQASSVWQQGFQGQNIKVAVVDSAVDVSHPQLQSRIAINNSEVRNNGIDDDRNGVVDDYFGASFFSASNSTRANDHGSHVAGIIAADNVQGSSMTGVAPKAQIIPATFLDGDGSGTLGDAILAMQYASSRGAQIINASWGGSGCDDSLGHAFADLSNKGILLVVAAGNSGADIDVTAFYPAIFNLANQITVSASSSDDLVPAWSNTGFRNSHLTAPGVDILSTGFGGRYVTMDGTSMASPFVAGAAAVLWSAAPTATAIQVKTAILRGVDVVAGKNSKTQTRGRLNLQKSLDELRRLVP